MIIIKQVIFFKISLTTAVFNSGFSEGSKPLTASGQCPRSIIQSSEQFELLYAILYYLYTEKVLLGADSSMGNVLGMPACDVEDLFAIAHRFEIPKLREKALDFLVETCTVENIVPRVFGKFALTYDEVSAAYGKVFYRYWNAVKNTKAFDEFFEALEEGEEDRRITVNRMFRDLIKALSPRQYSFVQM